MAKKSQSYFNAELTKSCTYCFYGVVAKAGTNILCQKNGVVPLDNPPCKKYAYDPFKRVPQAQIDKNEKYAEVIAENEQKREEKAKKYGYKIEEFF